MFIVDEETGDAVCRQGDSGKLLIEGLPTDRAYKCYFSVYDTNRKRIFELEEDVTSEGTVVFNLSPSNTNLLEVPTKQKSLLYFYGIKICCEEDDYEDTLTVGDKKYSDKNKLEVFPLITEGTING